MTQRTLSQNAALHKYLELLANELNAAGYDVGGTITMPVDFTKETVKKYLFKPVMRSMFPDIESTTQLTTTQLAEVYENLNRLTSDKFGIGIEFPHEKM